MLRISTTVLIAALTAGLASTAQAAVIYDASDTNTTVFVNPVAGAAGTPTGDTAGAGNMTMGIAGPNFAGAGVASTSDINTLNGSAITDGDVVTVQFTVDGVTGAGELRSRGLEFGIVSSTTVDGTGPDQLIVHVGGGGNSGAVALVESGTVGGFAETSFTLSNASVIDGFGMTLTANATDWSIEFQDAAASAGTLTTLTGTFDAGEFVSIFGNGHLYAFTQQRNGGVTVDYSELSIDVTPVPEPGSLALLGLGGLAMLRRRR